jgi:hypothetical protein
MQVRLMDQALAAHGAVLTAYQRSRELAGIDAEPLDWDHTGARAFLQRGEVRLSTLHRLAGLLLGGAGLLLLLPALLGQALPQLFTSLGMTWRVDPVATGCLAGVVLLSFAVPLWGYLLILEDLAGFFFTRRADNPHYVLTGLRLPYDEAQPWAFPQISDQYSDHVRLVVPDSQAWRAQFDQRVEQIYRPGQPIPPGRDGDRDRLLYNVRLASSERRAIASEVAKMELSLVRHVLSVQIVALRYMKAMLLVLITAITVLVASSMVTASGGAAADGFALLGSQLVVFLLWPPLAAGAVASPIRWIYRQNSSEAAGEDGQASLRDAYNDRRLVRFENAIVFVCIAASVLAVAAAVLAGLHGTNTVPLVLAGVAAAVLWIFVKTSWWKGSLRDTPRAFVQLVMSGAARQ